MKQNILIKGFIFLLFLNYSHVNAWNPFSSDDWKSVGSAITNTAKSAGNAIADTATKATNTVADTAVKAGNTIADTAVKAGDALKDYVGIPIASILGQTLSDIVTAFENDTPPPFCYNKSNRPKASDTEITIDDPRVQDMDTDKMIPLIKKYGPIVRLAPREYALPMAASEYFTGPQTEMKEVGTDKIVVPAGQVTNEKIYNMWKANPNAKNYFSNPVCITRGSNPEINRNERGKLNTPAYVQTFTYNNKLYIRYIWFFGFNAPYKIKNLLSLFQSAEKARDTANAHIADIEHVTLELNPETKNIERIYFASHGSTEGFWLNATDPAISWDNTHPIVYIARGGHGSYPQKKVMLRIFGVANDETGDGDQWEPNWVRVYYDNDKRFNPAVHGWTYHAGQVSKDGVGSVHAQFGPNINGDKGDPNRPYSAALKCDLGDSNCITLKGTQAKPPD